jgi:hypothetical protein
MPTYLIVAYQTAAGSPLRDALDEIMKRSPDADFRLVVPATRTQHLFTWTEGEATAVARATADSVADQLRSSGVPLSDVVVGDPDPYAAVRNELTARPDVDALIVSTFPPGISRWLRRDLPGRLEKETGLPITHVIVAPNEVAKTAESPLG